MTFATIKIKAKLLIVFLCKFTMFIKVTLIPMINFTVFLKVTLIPMIFRTLGMINKT